MSLADLAIVLSLISMALSVLVVVLGVCIYTRRKR